MSMIEEIEKELKEIRLWPWQAGIAGTCTVVSFNGDDVTGVAWAGERNKYFIAKSPERIAALLEYVKAQEEDRDNGTPETFKRFMAARANLGLK